MPNLESVAGDIAGAGGGFRFRRKGPVKRTPLKPHGPGVLWPRLYRKLREKGYSKEKAARISNEAYNNIRSGKWKRHKPRPPFPGAGGIFPLGNASALASGLAGDVARYGRVNPRSVRKSDIENIRKAEEVGVVVLRTAGADPIPGDEHNDPMHCTMVPFRVSEVDDVVRVVKRLAPILEPISATVSGKGTLGKDDAVVAIVQSDDLNDTYEMVKMAMGDLVHETFPNWIPHVSLAYGTSPEKVSAPDQFMFDHLGVWSRQVDVQKDFPLGTGIAKRDFSAKRRDKLAEKKKALPDGSFPIENREDLRNALRLRGHAKNKKAATRHIIRQALKLGARDIADRLRAEL